SVTALAGARTHVAAALKVAPPRAPRFAHLFGRDHLRGAERILPLEGILEPALALRLAVKGDAPPWSIGRQELPRTPAQAAIARSRSSARYPPRVRRSYYTRQAHPKAGLWRCCSRTRSARR